MDKEPADIVADCIGLQSSKSTVDEELLNQSNGVLTMIGEKSWLEEEQVMLVRNQMLAENDQVPVLDIEAGEDENLTERWVPHEMEPMHTPTKLDDILPKDLHSRQDTDTDVAAGEAMPIHSEELSMPHSHSQGTYPAGTSVVASVRSILAAHRALTSGTLIGTEHWVGYYCK